MRGFGDAREGETRGCACAVFRLGWRSRDWPLEATRGLAPRRHKRIGLLTPQGRAPLSALGIPDPIATRPDASLSEGKPDAGGTGDL